MKIAIPVAEGSRDAQVDGQFGRTAQFLLIDSDTMETEIKANEMNRTASHGAGIQASQSVIEAGAEAVIARQIGPKAFRVLNEAGLPIYLCDAVSAAEAVKQFNAGGLKQADGSNI